MSMMVPQIGKCENYHSGFFDFFFFFGARDSSRAFAHARQVLYYWTIPSPTVGLLEWTHEFLLELFLFSAWDTMINRSWSQSWDDPWKHFWASEDCPLGVFFSFKRLRFLPTWFMLFFSSLNIFCTCSPTHGNWAQCSQAEPTKINVNALEYSRRCIHHVHSLCYCLVIFAPYCILWGLGKGFF